MSTTQAPSPPLCTESQRQHLRYELDMLRRLPELLSTHREPQELHHAILESFGLHARVLLEFFYDKPDDARVFTARELLATWTPPPKSPDLGRVWGRLNSEIAHLGVKRQDGTPPEKVWDLAPIRAEILTIARAFHSQAEAAGYESPIADLVGEVVPLGIPGTTTGMTSSLGLSGATGPMGPSRG